MRIVVNDIAASTGGAMTVLRDFYSCVCQHDRENEWIFLLADRWFEETENVKIKTFPKVKKSGLQKLLFDYVTGRRVINGLKPDVVVSMQNIITFGVKAPQAVYIHQSIPFQNVKKFSFFKASERKLAVIQHLIGRIIRRSAKKSHRVIVQTRWIKAAICSKCGLQPDKVCVVSPDVHLQEIQPKEFAADSFFYPTARQLYKNNTCLMQASQILEEEGLDHCVTMTLPPELSKGKVRCVGRLPYSQVLEQYTGSTLVFPSYIETFGYPLAEARRMGTVVLASDCPFSREVLEGYENGYFFDPFKPQQLAQLMKQVITGQIEKKPVTQPASDSQDSWQIIMNTVIGMGR